MGCAAHLPSNRQARTARGPSLWVPLCQCHQGAKPLSGGMHLWPAVLTSRHIEALSVGVCHLCISLVCRSQILCKLQCQSLLMLQILHKGPCLCISTCHTMPIPAGCGAQCGTFCSCHTQHGGSVAAARLLNYNCTGPLLPCSTTMFPASSQLLIAKLCPPLPRRW